MSADMLEYYQNLQKDENYLNTKRNYSQPWQVNALPPIRSLNIRKNATSQQYLRVDSTRVNRFDVKPIACPALEEITVLNTFKVKSLNAQDSNSKSENFKIFSLDATSKWVKAKRIKIESLEKTSLYSPTHHLILFLTRSTPFYDQLRRREGKVDEQLRFRWKQEEIYPKTPQLPSDSKQKILNGLRQDFTTVLISKFGIEFTTKDLNTLKCPNWLNDEVINFYMQLIWESSKSELGEKKKKLPSMHIFSSFVFPKLRDRGYDAVKSYTRKITPSVLQRDIIFFPIHLGSHWCMASIDFRKKTITYYDSLHGTNNVCLKVLREWLAAESQDKLGEQFDFTGWVESCPKDIPSQKNGHDCGVFALVFAEHLSRDAPFKFSQKDMMYWRDRISYEILTGNLLQ